MKEATFIRQNMEKWRRVEHLVDNIATTSPDDLVDTYTEVSTDLAFARAHFPQSRITTYLNNLALVLHSRLYRNRTQKRSRLITFWTHEVPLAMYDGRKELRLSVIIFLVSVIIGIISNLGNPDFVRVILGDEYMNMTMENIRNGDPMAVYSGMSQTPMFLQITVNNIWVSFICFAMGMLTSVATGFFLMQNGVMVGAFTTFFAQQGLLKDCLLAMMLHGTLELTAIIVAAGAGIALGNGWLFPGTYSRMESLKRGAKKGAKIIVGTIPVFIIAAFIEGFFTRYTQVGTVPRLFVIMLSLLFVIFYFIVLPIVRHRHEQPNA